MTVDMSVLETTLPPGPPQTDLQLVLMPPPTRQSLLSPVTSFAQGEAASNPFAMPTVSRASLPQHRDDKLMHSFASSATMLPMRPPTALSLDVSSPQPQSLVPPPPSWTDLSASRTPTPPLTTVGLGSRTFTYPIGSGAIVPATPIPPSSSVSMQLAPDRISRHAGASAVVPWSAGAVPSGQILAPPLPLAASPASQQTLKAWDDMRARVPKEASGPVSSQRVVAPVAAGVSMGRLPGEFTSTALPSRSKNTPTVLENWSRNGTVATVCRPGVGLEAHCRDNQWWLVAPVDFKGLEKMPASVQAAALHRVDGAYGELEDSGQIGPPPCRGYREDDCLIS